MRETSLEEGLRPAGGWKPQDGAGRGQDRDRAGMAKNWVHCPPGGCQLYPVRLPSFWSPTWVWQQRDLDWNLPDWASLGW